MSNSLQHFGILGMKWGVRRYQNEDGSLTRAGEARQKYNEARSQEAAIIRKKGSFTNQAKAAVKTARARKDFKSTEILERLDKKPKSKTQLNLEAKYKKERGMNDMEAAVAAYKNIRARKVFAAVAGVAIAAGTAYGVYKYREHNVDKVIKAGRSLQNVSSDGTKTIRDAFYTTDNALDKVKYRGLYGNTLSKKGESVFSKTIKFSSDVKVASPKSGQAAFQDLVKSSPSFKNDLIDAWSDMYGKTSEQVAAIRSGNVTQKLYDTFNTNLVYHSPKNQKVTESFYKTLAEKGYNAVRDINDSKNSGYQAINPFIAFGTSGKIESIDVAELVGKSIARDNAIGIASTITPELAKYAAAATAVILGGKAGATKIRDISDQRQINQYRKDHPGTELTNTQIIRALGGV